MELAPRSAASHYVYAAVLEKQQRHAEALEQLARGLQGDSEHVPSLLLWSAIHLQSGDASGATAVLAAVARRKPANLEALDLYAQALLAKQDFASTQAIAMRSLLIAPETSAPRVILGELALKQGRLAAALIEFQKALIRDPG